MKRPSKRLLVVLSVISVLAVGLIGGTAAAQGPGGGNPLDQILSLLRNPDYGLEEIKNEVRAIETGVQNIENELASVSADVADIKAALEGGAAPGHLVLDVGVDERACLSLTTQCAGNDHNHDAPSPSNHNPVRIVVLVTLDGEQVTGLTAENFQFGTPFVPAGATGIALCPAGGDGCAPSAAISSSGGMYDLWAHPGPLDANWKAGTYFGRLVVTDNDGRTGAALVEIVITED